MSDRDDAVWWKRDKDFLNKLMQATREGVKVNDFLKKSFPNVNSSTLRKFIRRNSNIRAEYEEAKNRYLLLVEWKKIRREAQEESIETGEKLETIYERWGVNCHPDKYRVGEKGHPGHLASEREVRRMAKRHSSVAAASSQDDGGMVA